MKVSTPRYIHNKSLKDKNFKAKLKFTIKNNRNALSPTIVNVSDPRKLKLKSTNGLISKPTDEKSLSNDVTVPTTNGQNNVVKDINNQNVVGNSPKKKRKRQRKKKLSEDKVEEPAGLPNILQDVNSQSADGNSPKKRRKPRKRKTSLNKLDEPMRLLNKLQDEINNGTLNKSEAFCGESRPSILTKTQIKAKEKKCPQLKDFSVSNGTESEDEDEECDDSRFIGEEKLAGIIGPTNIQDFFKIYWEKKPLHIKRSNPKFYKNLLRTIDLHNMFRDGNLQFGKNVDVTSYTDGKRETHNPEGRVTPSVVWDLYNSGCSIRLLNPQTFHRPVWKILEDLQEYFTSFVGANVYLTPPGTQGFAPHWDDIEAFVMQLEGKKRWRVYEPRNKDETLPRVSSGNFGPDDELGEPVIDCVLEQGDLIYMPRGFIHQGNTLPEHHSMHITISAYQKTSWVDFMAKLFPQCLEAAADSLDMREGLPVGYLNHVGVVNSRKSSMERINFLKKAKELFNKILDDKIIDAAADQMSKDFVHCALPPVVSDVEKARSVFDGGEFWSGAKNKVINLVEIHPDSKIRLMRRSCVRLVREEGTTHLFYTLENSREYKAEELMFLEIEDDVVEAVETLIRTYPNYVMVENLPGADLETKMTLAVGLWEKGLVTTKEILDPAYDD